MTPLRSSRSFILVGVVLVASWATAIQAPVGPAILLPTTLEALGVEGPLAEAYGYAYERFQGVNLSSASETQLATQDVLDRARADLDEMRELLTTAQGTSGYVRESYKIANNLNEWTGGNRTNLSEARTPTSLANAIFALYDAHGIPLSSAEQLEIQDQATLLAALHPNVAIAAGVASYATVDALRYVMNATATMDQSAWDGLHEESWRLTDVHALIDIDSETSTLHFSENQTRYLNLARNYTESVDGEAYARGLDVLAQAADEIASLPYTASTFYQPDEYRCTSGGKVLLSTPHCLIVIGTWGNDSYRAESADVIDRFAVLLDFGGGDTYKNRVAAGRLAHGAPASSCINPDHFQCRRPVQLNVDMGAEKDIYHPGRKNGPIIGAAEGGVGLLYDAGGDDDYHADNTWQVLTMGAAMGGAALLFDRQGNDDYIIEDTDDGGPSFTHGAGLLGGFGILHDEAGEDQYWQRPAGQDVPFFGGGQGFGTLRGFGILFDEGSNIDTYEAYKDEAQGVGTLSGHGLLFDEGGANRFLIHAQAHTCGYPDTERHCPHLMAGWARGYGDTKGTGVLVTGKGVDTFTTTGNRTNQSYVDVVMFGAGNTSGFGVHYDRGGNDLYDALNNSHGHADSGLGLFINVGGDDTYECNYATCYGYGLRGALGLYYDGISNGDIYPDNLIHNGIWLRGELGVGIHTVSSGSDDDSTYDTFIEGPSYLVDWEREA